MAETTVSIQCSEDNNHERKPSKTQIQIVRMNSRHLDYKRRCSLFKKMLIVYVMLCCISMLGCTLVHSRTSGRLQ